MFFVSLHPASGFMPRSHLAGGAARSRFEWLQVKDVSFPQIRYKGNLRPSSEAVELRLPKQQSMRHQGLFDKRCVVWPANEGNNRLTGRGKCTPSVSKPSLPSVAITTIWI